jgi:enoyl-[acyl-carrier-protein] reductase (NADH)
LEPADVARVVLFFASDQSAGCTNHNYMVDAGIL